METMVLKAPPEFLYDRRKVGWTLLEDVPLKGDSVIGIRDFLVGDETHTTGETMLSRAKGFGNLAGQHHAECLLGRECCLPGQTKMVPKSWREYDLVFLGTLWGRADGSRHVVVLGYGDYGWGPTWRDLNEASKACLSRWDSPKRIVCLIE